MDNSLDNTLEQDERLFDLGSFVDHLDRDLIAASDADDERDD